MPRILLALVLAIFPLVGGTTCLGQEASKAERPVRTFEDSVRSDLVDSRATYYATARFLESERTRGYISATLWGAAGAGAMLLGVGPVAFVLVAPGMVDGLLRALEAGAIQKVVHGVDPRESRRRTLKRDYD